MSHFYLRVHLPTTKNCYWLFAEQLPGSQAFCYRLTDSALFAAAFHMSKVEITRQAALRVWPGCECIPIECSSNKIIPENMRNLLRIA